MLLDYMPTYYKKSKVFKALLKAYEGELNANNDANFDLQAQLFVDTATWGLSVWERELKIATDLAKPHLERREVIKSRLRGSGTCSAEMIKNTATAYTNAEIEVTENNSQYKFVIRFTGVKGVPADIEMFKSTIEAIKPAHLTYTIEYKYTVWGELKATTWDKVKKVTWGELMVKEVV